MAWALKSGKSNAIVPLHRPWGTIYGLEEKAEIFAQSLQTIYEGNPVEGNDDEVEEEVRCTAARIPHMDAQPRKR